ncbi:MAG: alkaline phosphatase D family protein [Erythrobacter sp.]
MPALLASGGLRLSNQGGFTHGVASGDPDQGSVTLWTRYLASGGEASWLEVEVARDEGFRNIVAAGAGIAGPTSDFCTSIRIENLRPGEWYYYRFKAPNAARSPVGRTRTLPDGEIDAFKIGVFSCANATSGWFNAYAHAAERDDLDLLVHLGDYIYETDLERSDALEGLADARGIAPPHELVSLADYRLRYASYRADPALQELHRRYPMISLWDDHETVNNSWRAGAKNHNPSTEGPWHKRMAAGVRAYHEWMPMRTRPYTSYKIGNLASLFRLETRLIARSAQLDADEWIAAHGGGLENAARAFRDGPLADPSRTMMGETQERWLSDGLSRSVASGRRWQILAQPVIMARTRFPTDPMPLFAADRQPPEFVLDSLRRRARLGELGVPATLDKWDGYPAARKRLFDASLAADANLVVLSGDSHNAWAFDLRNDETPVGVEFSVQGVSSLGIDKRLSGDPAEIAKSLMEANPDLYWCDTSQRGYMVIDVTQDTVTSEWLFIAAREMKSTAVQATHRVACAHGSRKLT